MAHLFITIITIDLIISYWNPDWIKYCMESFSGPCVDKLD